MTRGAIRGSTGVLAVLGRPIGRSRSPQMHNAALAALGLDYVYVALEVDVDAPAQVAAGIRALGLRGVNVTVPLKERLVPHLDRLEASAARAGAVNTILSEGGQLVGLNTDGDGLFDVLATAGRPPVRHALVLGAGGTGRAVAAAALARGASVTLLNRTVSRAEAAAAALGAGVTPGPLTPQAFARHAARADLVVHCTAAGSVALRTLDLGAFAGHSWVDVNYWEGAGRPAALASRAAFFDGTGMLACQGARALSRFTRCDVPATLLRAALEESA